MIIIVKQDKSHRLKIRIEKKVRRKLWEN